MPIPISKVKEIDLYFMYANNRKKTAKLAFSYEKHSHTIQQLKEEIGKRVNVNPNSIKFILSSFHSMERIEENKYNTNELRKKKKFKNLFAFEVPEEDLALTPEDRIEIDLQPKKADKSYHGNEIHRSISYFRTLIFKKNSTIKQIYQRVFKYFRFVFDKSQSEETKESWANLSDEQAFEKAWETDEKPFSVFVSASYSHYDDCFNCGERRCRNCLLKFEDERNFVDLLSGIKDSDYSLNSKLSLEIFQKQL